MFRNVFALLIAVFLIASPAQAAESIRIAFIDPLSGPFARSGIAGLRTFELAAELMVNDKGGVLDGKTFEIVSYDNQGSPKESLIQLKRAIDAGIRYIAQGASSSVANAITEAVDKHNRRNPDRPVLFLNYSANDPALTNEKCNFWHFRFDAHADMKMDAITDVIAADNAIKKVYVIGQDYSFGKAVAAAAVKFLGQKRPDIEIVGNELHPIGKVKDFSPYATKIAASGADAVITGNWGVDMVGLGKAIIDTGLDIPIITYYAAHDGITATFGEKGLDRIRVVHEGAFNPPSPAFAAFNDAFKAANPEMDINQPRIIGVLQFLALAMEKAGTDAPKDVALAMEGLEMTNIYGRKLYMRPADHQIIQDINVLTHTNRGIEVDADNSGYGLMIKSTVPAAGEGLPTSCDMKRPG
ncbi:branched-chain amino acid ABC transporter substrate-binding protein [Hwanghaeella sp.]|uniref:branched-chain amino acid ABC transporter substrate-binding protein n=1 Tax=Hwanghaeella sp. TaxID=2605943 RepID=UPI003CCC381F